MVLVAPGQPVKVDSRIVNPGIPIPPEAMMIHGITDEDAAEGMPLIEAVRYLVAKIKRLSGEGIPIVTMNGSYDITMLHNQATQLGTENFEGWTGPMLDLMVLDKKVDKWRKGSRKLDALCKHYKVDPEKLHDASSDALGAVLCVQALAKRYPNIRMKVEDLHRLQTKWRAEQQTSLSDYLVRSGEPALAPKEWAWPIQR